MHHLYTRGLQKDIGLYISSLTAKEKYRNTVFMFDT